MEEGEVEEEGREVGGGEEEVGGNFQLCTLCNYVGVKIITTFDFFELLVNPRIQKLIILWLLRVFLSLMQGSHL